jgi:hypothetical protein
MRFQIPAANEPVPSDYLRKLDEIDRLADSLDVRFRLPLTNVRFGWDPLTGLVPIAGDLAALALSVRIIATARALGAPAPVLRRMVLTAGLDAVIGAIPLAGAIFDLWFKANVRNVQLLMDEIRIRRRAPRP